MSKNTKFIGINDRSEDWQETVDLVCKKNNIESRHVNSRDTCIVMERENGIQIYENNGIIDFQNSYTYIKHKKNDTYFIYLLCEYLDHANIDFNDPKINKSSQHSGNKTSQMVRMFLDGVPIPDSIICTQNSYKKNKETILNKLSFPCVAKRSGSKGKCVWKIKNIQELEDVINMEPAHDTTLIQEFIPNSFDTRVFVFENKVIASIHRKSNDGFYNNISQGGSGEKATLSPREEDLCIQALQSSGLTMGGVDMVKDEKGNIYFFEVNKSPQIKMFEEYAKKPIRKNIIEEIISRYFLNYNKDSK